MLQAQNPRWRKGIQSHSLPDGSAVLFDANRKTACPMNASALVLWGCCDGSRTVEEIVEHMSTVFDAPRDRIARDVDATLKRLLELDLLELTLGGHLKTGQ